MFNSIGNHNPLFTILSVDAITVFGSGSEEQTIKQLRGRAGTLLSSIVAVENTVLTRDVAGLLAGHAVAGEGLISPPPPAPSISETKRDRETR